MIPVPRLTGMIHLPALPGSPEMIGQSFDPESAVKPVVEEARILADAGIDALLIENMHDRPYLRGDGVGPETVAAMTLLARAVRERVSLPCGVQVLAAANRQALAIAVAAGLEFVRVEGFVFGHVADEGYIDGCAGDLLRYRSGLGAEAIAVWADIKKKHSAHALTSDVDIATTARAAEFCGADALIVTGSHTGESTNPEDIIAARNATALPVLVGSGLTPENAPDLLPHADGAIVGSSLKHEGTWENRIDPARARALVAAAGSGPAS